MKYILLLFHISPLYVRFAFLMTCQLKEIDSTCIISTEKSNFLKKYFFSILWKILMCRIKRDAIFGLRVEKCVRKRYHCLCLITPPILYLTGIIDNSVIMWDEISDPLAESNDKETKTITTNFNEKNAICKTQNFHILLVFLSITLYQLYQLHYW